MKIADVNEFYATQGGGVRRYVEGKLEAAAQHGHDLSVVAPGPEDRIEPRRGGRIVWIKGPPLPPDPRYYILWNQRAVHDALADVQPDIVEGSSVWTSGWFAANYRSAGPTQPRKVLFFHQDAVAVYGHTLLDRMLPERFIDQSNLPFWWYLRRLSARVDNTVVAGAWLRDRLEAFGIHQPVSIPLGINKSVFSPELRSAKERDALCDQCGVARNAKVLVAVSRHHPEKRIGTMLRAIDLVNQTRQVGLVLFGDGPLRSFVERKAARIPQVVVSGYRDEQRDLARVLASADGFLHGSAAETYGLVVAEAIAAGTPIIVPDRGGASDLADSAHGETYRPGDANACARAILRLLQRDPKPMREAAVRYRGHSIGTMEDHFVQLFGHYERLTAE